MIAFENVKVTFSFHHPGIKVGIKLGVFFAHERIDPRKRKSEMPTSKSPLCQNILLSELSGKKRGHNTCQHFDL